MMSNPNDGVPDGEREKSGGVERVDEEIGEETAGSHSIAIGLLKMVAIMILLVLITFVVIAACTWWFARNK